MKHPLRLSSSKFIVEVVPFWALNYPSTFCTVHQNKPPLPYLCTLRLVLRSSYHYTPALIVWWMARLDMEQYVLAFRLSTSVESSAWSIWSGPIFHPTLFRTLKTYPASVCSMLHTFLRYIRHLSSRWLDFLLSLLENFRGGSFAFCDLL